MVYQSRVAPQDEFTDLSRQITEVICCGQVFLCVYAKGESRC